MYTLEVLNPVAQQRGALTAMPINPRPASLSNKTVGLLWSGTHGGDVALKRAGEDFDLLLLPNTDRFTRAGDALDGARITRITPVPLAGDRTWDILPSGDTGLYIADGVVLRSTFAR